MEQENTEKETLETKEVINNIEKPHKKRGRKPNPENRKGYFYEKEEEAFVKYLTSNTQEERNKIFREYLYQPFTKMIESIIRKYSLFTPTETFEETFHDTMSFLLTKINNYDVTKGKKAYSYCGTICKNFLILKRNNSMKKRDKQIPYDLVFPSIEKDTRPDKSQETQTNEFNSELIDKVIESIHELLENSIDNNLTTQEIEVGYALLEMLMNWEDIFKRLGTKKFNKTSVLYFIKEYTLLDTKEVRNASKIYKNLYFSIKKNMVE